MRTLSAASTEYVECTVDVFNPTTNQLIDPSNDTVEMAFVGIGATPASLDWKPATWTAVRRAGILVGPGPGGVVLAIGDYDWWIRITDSPEKPVLKVDTLRVE